eukprot:TRINITY_DN1602_c1_g1_i2.p2 TRINITY_DN1602_c1_g1~~TRINITY_DN1602_c1_g1_i2.p2  ORF type:complete len:100 (-),score=30.40 TRINITY_DN1602_c1_g1_i2:111-410(-)
MKTLKTMIEAINAVPMFGGTYPNGYYQQLHYDLCITVDEEMRSWGVPVFDFMGATAQPDGTWIPQYEFNAGHPNDEGHKAMFDAIPIELFTQYKQDHEV